MRKGEILALNWNQLDFRRMCIKVERAYKNETKVGKPKWNKIRVTPIPGPVITPLMFMRGMQLEVYADDLVYSYADKSRLGGTWWHKNFRKGLDNVGIDYRKRYITPHSFRHTLNSLLREQGYDAAKIRDSLGWSSVDVQDGYTHWSDEAFVEHSEIVGRVFG